MMSNRTQFTPAGMQAQPPKGEVATLVSTTVLVSPALVRVLADMVQAALARDRAPAGNHVQCTADEQAKEGPP